MLFADRLEVWNPGTLPPSLTLEMLRQPHGSVPGNPLLAEPLYLTKYIERMGTGTGDMIERCRKAGLPEPEFALTSKGQMLRDRLQKGKRSR
jgi:predicted HTH transcriptional regulator